VPGAVPSAITGRGREPAKCEQIKAKEEDGGGEGIVKWSRGSLKVKFGRNWKRVMRA